MVANDDVSGSSKHSTRACGLQFHAGDHDLAASFGGRRAFDLFLLKLEPL